MRFLVIIVYFCSTISSAQNRFEKRIDANVITTVHLCLDWTSSLKIKTTTSKNIVVIAIAEGAYQNRVTLVVEQQNKEKINISDVLQPHFEMYNDKLSAHKVYAISTTVMVPENMQLSVIMNSGKIDATGRYKELLVNTNTSDVYLSDFNGNATIMSKSGAIKVAMKNQGIQTVTDTDFMRHIVTESGNELLLKTIRGSIIINK